MPYYEEYESLTINIYLRSGRSYSHYENHMLEIKSPARSEYCVKGGTLQDNDGNTGVHIS